MIATLRDQPNFSELFMADLLSRNSRIEEDLIDQSFNSSEKRLARALLLLANFGKENGRRYIKYNGNLEIHNSLLNVVLYDKPEISQERSSLGGEGS